MSLQDDIFDIEELLEEVEAEKYYIDAFDNICKVLYFLEEENERLIKENNILMSTIKIIDRPKEIKRIKVTSSNIASAGYDIDKLILEIEFLNGSVYQYFDVPQHVYGRLLVSESKGKYFSKYIKDIYKFEKIKDKD